MICYILVLILNNLLKYILFSKKNEIDKRYKIFFKGYFGNRVVYILR